MYFSNKDGLCEATEVLISQDEDQLAELFFQASWDKSGPELRICFKNDKDEVFQYDEDNVIVIKLEELIDGCVKWKAAGQSRPVLDGEDCIIANNYGKLCISSYLKYLAYCLEQECYLDEKAEKLLEKKGL